MCSRPHPNSVPRRDPICRLALPFICHLDPHSRARSQYLHESRHKHAVNRVRGAKGRFVNLEKEDAAPAGLPEKDTDDMNEETNGVESDQHDYLQLTSLFDATEPVKPLGLSALP